MTFILAVSVYRSIGILIAALVVVGFIVFSIINARSGRPEVGSEIELAANRRPYFSDEELEGRRLDRVLSTALVLIAVVGIGLPVYWLNEPGRQDGAEAEFVDIFENRGELLFESLCQSCHGPKAVGGAASYTLLDEETDEFIAQVNWQAPALDTVMLRYSEEEVTYVLNHGRTFSPMPPWGEPGGGALTVQQLQYLVAYLESIRLEPEAAQQAALDQLTAELGHEPNFSTKSGRLEAGEVLFNLGREDGFAGGAYSCGRCHTQGWSYFTDPSAPPDRIEAPDGSGALGPNLTEGDTVRQFPALADHLEFITLGSEDGKGYGQHGQGRGVMPGFGENPNTESEFDGMLTEDMIAAIVEYERSL